MIIFQIISLIIYCFIFLMKKAGGNPSAEFSSAILQAVELKSYSACASNDMAFPTPLSEARVVTE